MILDIILRKLPSHHGEDSVMNDIGSNPKIALDINFALFIIQ